MSGSQNNVVAYSPLLANYSQPSMGSRTTTTSNPPKEAPLITSTWGIGWQTPVVMAACYALALILAVVHFVLFTYINGKDADGPNRVAPQSYVTTASNIIANLFGFSLRASLAVSFVQRLWLLLRSQTMKVSTIEAIFSIRTNLFMLFKPAPLMATPVLCLLALIMWISQFITAFPPGAISVILVQKTSFEEIRVPTYNASFMGFGSGVDADAFALSVLTPVRGSNQSYDGFVASGFSGIKNSNLMSLLARRNLVAGETFVMPSPCGANCSYVTEFEGPYMNCNTNSINLTLNDATGYFIAYAGQWSSPLGQSNNPKLFYNGTYTQATFNATTLTPIQANGTLLQGNGNSSAIIQRDTTTCRPWRAKFTVNNTYTNNVLHRQVVTQPIDTLVNLLSPNKNGLIIVPGFLALVGNDPGTVPANWSTYALNYYRDNNFMAIHTSVVSWLNGSFLTYMADGENRPVVSASDTLTAYPSYLAAWNEQMEVTRTTGQTISLAAQNGTIIESTRFNAAFDHFSLNESSHPAFNVTQDLLNDYLFNMTASLMLAYNLWSVPANATKHTMINVYSFSQPLSLVLPYFVTLFVSMPFVIMGFMALFKNGVSAMDGGFMQIIATSTGSATLDRAAAGGCLGGDESMPKELKDLEIKFGEFVGRDAGVKRAGFGVESEIKPLNRGAKYGIAKWI